MISIFRFSMRALIKADTSASELASDGGANEDNQSPAVLQITPKQTHHRKSKGLCEDSCRNSRPSRGKR